MFCCGFRSMALVVLCGGLASFVLADEVATEIREDIEILVGKSSELDEHGEHDRAHAMRDRIRDLERQLEQRMRSRDEKAERSRDRRNRLLEQVAAGAEALEALGRHEAAHQLHEVLHQLRHGSDGERRRPVIRREVRRVERREDEHDRPNREREASRERSRRDREHEGERNEHPESRGAREQVNVLGLAAEVLADAHRPDGAEVLRHARRALQLTMEGRRGDEAHEIRESAPSREEQAEWLMLASRVLNERGRREQAHAAANLAERLRHRRRDQEPREDRNVPSHGELWNHMRELEHRLEELHRLVERLHDR